MTIQKTSPLPSERAQNSAARWVLWGYVIISTLGIMLHSVLHLVDRSAVDWLYILPMGGIGIVALYSLNRLPHSLSRAMYIFAWSAFGCITIILIHQLEGNGEYQSIIPMFHVGIFSLGLILGFMPATQYAAATTAILAVTSLVYGLGIGNTIVYIVLAYAASLPAKVVEKLIEQRTAELAEMNLRLETLVQDRTAELLEEIAERKRVEESLRQRTLKLEKQNEELDAYAHTVAHDLKSPLSSLIGFVDLLGKRYEQMPREKIPYFLTLMSQNGRKVISIVDELLLLASVRAVEEVPQDVDRVVVVDGAAVV